MDAIKGHFDGTAIVLDEPATLAVGQAVRIIVVDESADELPREQPSLVGFAKHLGPIIMSDDFNDPLEEFADYQ